MIYDLGQLESTMFAAFTRAASLRRWIARPDCPEFLRECQAVFNKTFGGGRSNPNLSDDNLPQSAFAPTPHELQHLISDSSVALRARHHYDDVIFSRASTHIGNSLILFYPTEDSTGDPIPGSIEYIIIKHSKEVVYAVRTQMPASTNTPDPFRFYPHFPAKMYSPNLSPQLTIVQPSSVMSHYARWKMDENRVVVLTLARVSGIAVLSARYNLTKIRCTGLSTSRYEDVYCISCMCRVLTVHRVT